MSGMRIKWDTGQLKSIIQAGGDKGLYKAAHVVAHESKKQVSIDQATLLRSQEVDVSRGVAAVSYDTPYAAYQHEGQRADGTYQVKQHSRAGRKTKYLEDPVNDPANYHAVLAGLADGIKF